VKICKKFTSETSHVIKNACSKRCQNIHGHRYLWIVYFEGALNSETGMITDFKNLGPVKNYIDLFDHSVVLWEQDSQKRINFMKEEFPRVLIMKKNCTAENMARAILKFSNEWISSFIPNVKAVQCDVWETETGCGIATEYDENDILVYQHLNID
jgi:6-pyruvoyltetrahydropterin/6-carboxytetrahydropterin synthase